MATQPDGFVIGEEELAKAIIEVKAHVTTIEVVDDNLDEDVENIEDGENLMDDDDEIVANLPEEMTFGPDDDIPPYEFN